MKRSPPATRGLARQLEREPHSIGSADPHQRTEFGEVETREHGRLMVAHDRSDGGSLMIHGVTLALNDVDKDLRQFLIATSSAAFNAAESAEDQVAQRAIIGLIVSEVLRRSEFLSAEVKRRVSRQRYD